MAISVPAKEHLFPGQGRDQRLEPLRERVTTLPLKLGFWTGCLMSVRQIIRLFG
jgi:hypothetical protein